MFYFIPYWKNNDENDFWDNTPSYWYRVQNNMAFDDIVSQLKLFNATDERAEALVLDYSPNLRTFLHQQAIDDVPYYSLFDKIQGIEFKGSRQLNYKDLNWPDNLEFIYTPFLINVRQNGHPYAQVHFNSMGKLFLVERYEQKQIIKNYIFDDRGFLSSMTTFSQGQKDKQYFLNTQGEWRICLHHQASFVEVNAKFQADFLKERYASMSDLVIEKYRLFLDSHVTEEDVLVYSSQKEQNDFILDIETSADQVLAFFADRYDLADEKRVKSDLSKVDQIVVDTDDKNTLLQFASKPILTIPPFDTRLRLGLSQQLKELKLFVLITDESKEEIEWLLDQLVPYANQHENVELTLANHYRSSFQKSDLNRLVDEKVQKYGLEDVFVFDKQDDPDAEMERMLNDEEPDLTRTIAYCAIDSEDDVIKAFQTMRLIVDLSQKPDLFVQIAGISSGIPQINLKESPYVENGKNGLAITDKQELISAINYYFEGLANWNQALMYSVDKIDQFSGYRLVEKWKEMLGRR